MDLRKRNLGHADSGSTASEIDNFVIVFPDPETLAPGERFSTEQVSPNVSYFETITDTIQTLSSNNADSSGTIHGFLYVPDIPLNDPCRNITADDIPQNVTRQANLPHSDINLIGLAPWQSAACTLAFLNAALTDPIRAFIFYLPDNGTVQPPQINAASWNLHDGGQWKGDHPFPVYAVPGNTGARMMDQLSLYSGNLLSVPNGHDLSDAGFDPRDYVRIYTNISIATQSSMPGLWVFLLIVIGSLAFILALTSGSMHYIQRRRRQELRRRVMSGDVNLEALGIKRLTVPPESISRMPQFIYTCPKDDTTTGEEHPGSGNNSPTIEVRDTVSGAIIQSQMYQPDSQPTCPICLDDFVSGTTVIRELPCGHIFHPECIDSFLGNNSSLCPMCKKSALPFGYCPERITNAMVRRERMIRRIRENGNEPRRNAWRTAIRRCVGTRHVPGHSSTANIELEEQPTRFVIPAPVVPPGAGRQEITQLRTQAILQDHMITDQVVEERQRPKWRRALSRIFPIL